MSETMTKTGNLNKAQEEMKTIEEVLFSAPKELKQVKTSVTPQEPSKTEVVEVSVQAFPDMADAST